MESKSRRASIDEGGVQRWDRSRWISVFSSHNPTIREVTECLGLGLSASSSTTNRGIPKFDNPEYRKISSEVTKLSKELPKEREALLDFAADPTSLDDKLEELLSVYGPAIWGKDTDRTCLLKPDDAKKTYSKHLYFENLEDKEVLKIHLHRWIIIKACYYIRNMKLKRSSIEYETLADIEVDGAEGSPKPQLLSPDGTPQQSASPPPITAIKNESENPTNERKRKIAANVSLSDGEENSRPPVKRPYHSATVPIQRKSPRKSLKSLAMANTSENVPPLLSHNNNHFQPPVTTSAALETTRPLLSPLTSNDLNGAVRPPVQAPTPAPVVPAPVVPAPANKTSPSTFTAVNSTPTTAHTAPLARNYSSPYGPPGTSQPTPPTVITAAHSPPANGFQAINSPVISNGTSARNSPIVQTVSFANIAPQPTVPSHTTTAPPPYRHNSPHTQQSAAHHPHASPHRHNSPHPQSAHQPQTTSHPQATPQPQAAAQPKVTTQSQAPVQHVSHPQMASYQHATPHPQIVHHAQTAVRPHAPPYLQTVPHPQSAAHPSNVHHAHHASMTPVSPVITHPLHAAHAPPAPPAQKILKSQPSEPLPSASDTDLLQCELLGTLMQYLFPKPDYKPNEVALLRNLEYLWNLKAISFHQQMGHHYDVQSKVLGAWIEERRKINLLRRSMETEPGVPAPEMVDRLLAMNDLRVLRLKWKTMNTQDGNQTLSPEDLLCRTFAAMTNTEGTEYLFKDGLDRLNDDMFEFLRTEDMKIMMTKH
ncbi:hypothetical protein K504DRAFT_464730 [Pleomassaria siparia CBS 279.74]|uniref:Uncharacterized protein n=1 Tax=Pleomassaria siparia CBS 279.74 TaxID=1314801 RepID=A0A6G1KIQ0_9PLEO|nr:hypothetical protein K504DRAFT_464730 [Pleomassaria siparia CBS 279.74]